LSLLSLGIIGLFLPKVYVFALLVCFRSIIVFTYGLEILEVLLFFVFIRHFLRSSQIFIVLFCHRYFGDLKRKEKRDIKRKGGTIGGI